jgi:hypothetical protein
VLHQAKNVVGSPGSQQTSTRKGTEEPHSVTRPPLCLTERGHRPRWRSRRGNDCFPIATSAQQLLNIAAGLDQAALDPFEIVKEVEDGFVNHLGGRMRPRDLAAMVGRAFLATPGLSLRAPKVIVGPLNNIFNQSNSAKHVEKDPFFDYGAPIMALDRVRSIKYRRYFQRLDKEMYDKVLERTVLDSIVQILDQHGIDTAEIAERRATIINNGILMKDSTLNADNLAVGPRSGINIKIPRPGGNPGADGTPSAAASKP